MAAAVAWISLTPVKGLRLAAADEAELTEDGIPGDRAFFLADARGAMVSSDRHGPLTAVIGEHDAAAETLTLRRPDGEVVAGPVELGEPQPVRFYGLNLSARPVLGPFSAALSEVCHTPLRMFAMPPGRPGVDRGRDGAVTLLSLGSLERLRIEAGESEPVDPRRFRMNVGIDGLDPHEEDGWIGRDLRVGAAVLRVVGNVGRCVVTTRNADTGVVDCRTLQHLAAYRQEVATTEPLPFGVHARVLAPGRVRVGDPVALAWAPRSDLRQRPR